MPTLSERLYKRLSGDTNGANAKGISDAAAKVVAPNFVIQVFASIATKTGDQLLSPRLVLTWLMATVNAPAAAIALVVPVREAFALLPQLFAGALIQRRSVRKWFWVGGSLTQGLCVIAMIVVALVWSGSTAGWSLLGLLVVFSCGRVFCSITGKDLRGKTLPKRRRGLAGGTASALAGGTTVAVAVYLVFVERDATDLATLTGILGLAAALWFLGALTYARLREYPGEAKHDGQPLLKQISRDLAKLNAVPGFKRFILVRIGLIGNALVLPLVVLAAFEDSKGSSLVLGALVGGSGLAAFVSSFVWGRLADRSSRALLIVVGFSGAVIAGLGLLIDSIALADPVQAGLLVVVFFLLAVLHQGTRIGRKTYVIDLAKADSRVNMVALANTLTGIALLVLGGVVGALATIDSSFAIGFCALASFTGAQLALKLPEVES